MKIKFDFDALIKGEGKLEWKLVISQSKWNRKDQKEERERERVIDVLHEPIFIIFFPLSLKGDEDNWVAYTVARNVTVKMMSIHRMMIKSKITDFSLWVIQTFKTNSYFLAIQSLSLSFINPLCLQGQERQ